MPKKVSLPSPKEVSKLLRQQRNRRYYLKIATERKINNKIDCGTQTAIQGANSEISQNKSLADTVEFLRAELRYHKNRANIAEERY